MAKTQKYGIKFPTTINYGDTMIDLNKTLADSVKSQLIHLIFTPVGQKVRDPLFGTSLIQFIFNPSDSQTWGDIVFEIKDKVKSYVSNCSVKDVETTQSDEGLGVNVRVVYEVTEKDGAASVHELNQTI